MDKDTMFLLDRIDTNHKEVMAKIDLLSGWKNKITGASMVIAAMVSTIVSFIISAVTGK